jgi:uroporphyrinogen decarboxylase
MTARERYIACLTFGDFDRPFLTEWGPWGATLERWKAEGMEGDSAPEYSWCDPQIGMPVNFGPLPVHDRRVVSEDERTVTYVDERGITRREKKVGAETSMPDFVEYPLKTRRDWEEDLAPRYDPDTPGRFPDNWAEWAASMKSREAPLIVSAYPHLGVFGPIRDLMGVEAICPMLYDDPGLMRDIAAQWGNFHYRILERIVADVVPDAVCYWEDMAFHTAPLISPRMFSDFFGVHYRRINDMLREAGVPVIGVDSDGCVWQLLDPFLDCGIFYVWPMEVAAHMDVREVRRRYGRRLSMHGGLDKRALAAGPAAIDRELEAKLPVAWEGGYIPSVDHSLPPDISYPSFQHFMRRKHELLTTRPS